MVLVLFAKKEAAAASPALVSSSTTPTSPHEPADDNGTAAASSPIDLSAAIGKLWRRKQVSNSSPRKNESYSCNYKRPLAVVTPPPELPLPAASSGSSPFERVFRYFDSDGDGKISPSELRSCMNMNFVDGGTGNCQELELSLEDAEAVVEANDSDGDGFLGLDDFVRLMQVEGEEERRRDLAEAFGMYEMEGLGCITPKSLNRMLTRLGQSTTIDHCKTMISRFDLDGDGVLSFDEFTHMMML
ncbi:hypothetical protein H6P81_000055 [Aristolochia fimbriata]|uniref:EF-hand domain-containing protein n=1 Tax=Aristolochia fimbriata TaxID=158543 RepID=A0AAV7F6C5_ARIFI|nr:hypothetical protein H6P81_000055 [Aristolochia fimbriata]